MTPHPPSQQMEDDPSFHRSRREAIFILCLWASCFLYSVPYCYINGYLNREPLPSSTGPDVSQLAQGLNSHNRQPGSVTYPLNLGIPDWVFWGVAVPWCICILITVIFCVFIFAEDSLHPDHDEDSAGL